MVEIEKEVSVHYPDSFLEWLRSERDKAAYKMRMNAFQDVLNYIEDHPEIVDVVLIDIEREEVDEP